MLISYHNDNKNKFMMLSPSIDKNNNISFVAHGDLYLLGDTFHYRITDSKDIVNTSISPSGSRIAFTRRYKDSNDIYYYDILSKNIKRITYYLANSFVLSWKDDNTLYFKSNFESHSYLQYLYYYDFNTEKIIRSDIKRSISYISFAQGKTILQLHGYGYGLWNGYRGGKKSTVWIESKDKHIKSLLPEYLYNIERPHLIKNNMYYMSSIKNEVGNIYKDGKKITNHKYYVHHLSSNGKCLVYSSGGEIYKIENDISKKVEINIPVINKDITVNITENANYYLHHDDKVSITFAGEILSIYPLKSHSMEKISNKMYKYCSSYKDEMYAVGYDIDGSYIDTYKNKNLISSYRHVDSILKIYPIEKYIIAITHKREILLINKEDKTITIIDKDEYYPIRDLDISNNENLIVYSKSTTVGNYCIMIYEISSHKINKVSSGLCYECDPIFFTKKNSNYIVFFSGRKCTAEYSFIRIGYHLNQKFIPYILPLDKESVSPFIKPMNEISSTTNDLSIDINRSEPFQVKNEDIIGITKCKDQLIFYTRENIYKYDFDELSLKEMCKGKFIMSNDNNILFEDNNKLKLIDIELKEVDITQLITNQTKNGISLYMSREKFHTNILFEAWRLQKNYFYKSSNNKWQSKWTKTYKRISKLFKDITTLDERLILIREMHADLSSSHAFAYPSYSGTRFYGLGIEYKFNEENKCVITKIYDTDQMNEELFLHIKTTRIKEGDIISKVDGLDIHNTYTLEHACLNKKNIVMTINNNEEYYIKLSNNMHKILDNIHYNNNRKIAHENNIGYISIPDMLGYGFSEFYKSFIAETEYKNVIIDLIYNSGGNASSDIIPKLMMKTFGYECIANSSIRVKYPLKSVNCNFFLLISEDTSSDGELYAYSFKKNKLGTIIGRDTWGGTIGIHGCKTLIDGVTRTSQPEVEIVLDSKIEGRGVKPNIYVEDSPYDEYTIFKKAIEIINNQ